MEENDNATPNGPGVDTLEYFTQFGRDLSLKGANSQNFPNLRNASLSQNILHQNKSHQNYRSEMYGEGSSF